MNKLLTISVLVCFISVGVVFAAPQDQPRVQSGDITYLGYFDLPDGEWLYGQGIAISSDGTKLYINQAVDDEQIGIITIPSLSGTSSVDTAQTSISGSTGSTGNDSLGGFLHYNNRLIIQKKVAYDADSPDGLADNSHLACNSALGSCTAMSPMESYGSIQHVTGYMGLIPSEWQTLLGGPAFSGNSAMSINSGCSNGPSFYVFDPDDVGVESPIPHSKLMDFTVPNILGGAGNFTSCQESISANDYYTCADQNNAGIVFPSGTRSVLFFSTHGYGTPTYKSGTDPCHPTAPGEEAYPYRLQITAFDATDLLAVKNGTKEAHEVEPYAWWELPDPAQGAFDTCVFFTYSGLTYDPSTRRIYLRTDTYERIFVYEVAELSTTETGSATASGSFAGQ